MKLGNKPFDIMNSESKGAIFSINAKEGFLNFNKNQQI